MKSKVILFIVISLFLSGNIALSQSGEPELHYRVFMDEPETHKFHMELSVSDLDRDTILFKMPNWMPGYYQLMDYSSNVDNVIAKYDNGDEMPVNKTNSNTWRIIPERQASFMLSYDIKTNRQFVANSYIDSSHAYIIPENNFFYICGGLDMPISIEIVPNPKLNWSSIATGLVNVDAKSNEFIAANFDILYDCPILIGDLEELPSFQVNGINHRFIGYNLGNFNRESFMNNLKKVVEAAVSIFDDIPYEQYTFIAIGPGRGGIEHLNNTTISFDGNQIKDKEDMLRMMNFIGHEYFHHYNVKRIRPFELGPFNYDKKNRTTQLWISEGLTVYYEYILTKMSGLADEKALLAAFENHINSIENNPGRWNQSLVQSSYNTWEDGPFGIPGKTISYYQKGPVVGLLLDFAIRNATQNKKSLDDVMRYLYWHYYKKLTRGFTDAEFQEACEMISGKLLTKEFEYVHTTKELDYNTYLNYAGLEIVKTDIANGKKGEVNYRLKRKEEINALQSAILKSWLRE